MGSWWSRDAEVDEENARLAAQVDARRRRAALRKLPRLPYYEFDGHAFPANKFAADYPDNVEDKAADLGQAAPVELPVNFECASRVSGRREPWKWLHIKACAEWVRNGDLLVDEANDIIRRYGIDDESGAVRLKKVYDVLTAQGL